MCAGGLAHADRLTGSQHIMPLFGRGLDRSGLDRGGAVGSSSKVTAFGAPTRRGGNSVSGGGAELRVSSR